MNKKIIPTILYMTLFPVVLPAGFFLLGLYLDRLTGIYFHDPDGYLHKSGVLFMFLGGVIVFCATCQLWIQGKGMPVSSLPPKKFVHNGIYALSRHPVYMGGSLLFGGLGLLSHSFWTCCLGWPLLTLFFAVYALCVEEPVLMARYGKDYTAYRKRVSLLAPLPFRKWVRLYIEKILTWISDRVNHPFILHHGDHIFFLGYGLWCGLGIMAGLFVFNGLLYWLDVPARHIAILLILITMTCLAGIRMTWIAGTFFHTKGKIKSIMGRVGFVSWGVLLGTVLSGIVFVYLTGRSLITWLDLALFSQMLTHFFGRIGCLFYGCCYGKESHSDFYIYYSHPALKAVRENLVYPARVHPVQIYSAGYGLLIFIILWMLMSNHRVPVGLPAALVCVLYSTFRFTEEWCRVQKKLFWNLLSPSQLFCIILFCFGMTGLVVLQQVHARIYQPLMPSLGIKTLTHHFQYSLLFVLGLLSTLVFSYHRHEIGRWAKENSGGGH
jgi:phosphatidylglycerol---prolipoprotein diacylglyceryl transferase